jgi:hypothetical protein
VLVALKLVLFVSLACPLSLAFIARGQWAQIGRMLRRERPAKLVRIERRRREAPHRQCAFRNTQWHSKPAAQWPSSTP